MEGGSPKNSFHPFLYPFKCKRPKSPYIFHVVFCPEKLTRIEFIFQACKYGRVQHLEHLLFYGAEMNIQNSSGNTPLHVCAVNNQVNNYHTLSY